MRGTSDVREVVDALTGHGDLLQVRCDERHGGGSDLFTSQRQAKQPETRQHSVEGWVLVCPLKYGAEKD